MGIPTEQQGFRRTVRSLFTTRTLSQGVLWTVTFTQFLPLIALCILGVFARYAADDFDLASSTQERGVGGMVTHYYLYWTGRYSFLLLFASISHLFPGVVWFLPIFALLLWLSGIVTLIAPVAGKAYALCVSGLVLATALTLTPDPPASFLWAASMLGYVPPLICLTWCAAVLGACYRRLDAGRTISYGVVFGIGLLAFVGAGFSEMVSLVQVVAFAYLTLWSFWRRPNARLLSFITFLGAAAGIVVMVMAPGNTLRETHFHHPHPSLLLLAQKSLSATSYFWGGINYIYSPDIFDLWPNGLSGPGLVMLWVFGMSAALAPKGHLPLRALFGHLTAIALAGFISTLLCFVPAYWGMGARLPDRALIVPTFFAVTSVVAAGWLVGPAVRSLVLSRHALVAILCVFLLWGLWVFPLRKTKITLDRLPAVVRQAAMQDAQDASIRAAVRTRVTHMVIPGVQGFEGPNGLNHDPTFWVNVAVARYYHLQSVTVR